MAVNAQAPSGWGYLFGGVGGITNGDTQTIVHIGAGGEGVLAGNFGVGGEVGYLSRADDFGNGLGIASLNVVAVFNRSAKVNPFLTGGGSLAFRSGGYSGGGNFGGGVQTWINDHAALRFEFRNHIFSSDSPYAFSFRFGLAFK